MSVVQKILASFLFSGFLFAGVLFLALSGNMVNGPEGTLILTAVFLTLFLVIFFCFNLRQEPADADVQPLVIEELEPAELESADIQSAGMPSGDLQSGEVLEELEAVDESEPADLRSMVNPPRIPDVQLCFDDDDVPYLVESTGLELADGDIEEIVHSMASSIDATPEYIDQDLEELAELEEIILEEEGAEEIGELEEITTKSGGTFSIFRQPGVHAFAFSWGNPELLDAEGIQDAKSTRAENSVIYEQNGVHYVNSNLENESGENELDSTFAKLVESVVNAGEE